MLLFPVRIMWSKVRIVFCLLAICFVLLLSVAQTGTSLAQTSVKPTGKILYWELNGNDYDAYVVDIENPTPIKLSPQHGVKEEFASWSPDGKQIVFQDDVNITVTDENGANLIVVGNGLSPLWTPDSQSVIYVQHNSIRVVKADGSGDSEIFKGDAGSVFTLFGRSADANLIYARIYVDGKTQGLYVIDATTKSLTFLLNDNDLVSDPVLSPDKNYISYWTFPSGTNSMLYSIQDDMSTVIYANHGGRTSWMPDSQSLVLGTENQIRFIDIASQEIKIINDTDGIHGAVAWSPDGQYFAFSGREHDDITVMSADGDVATKLLTEELNVSRKVIEWQPNPS